MSQLRTVRGLGRATGLLERRLPVRWRVARQTAQPALKVNEAVIWEDMDADSATLLVRVGPTTYTIGGAASLSDANPVALGVASSGTGADASRYDHVHPTTGLARLAEDETVTGDWDFSGDIDFTGAVNLLGAPQVGDASHSGVRLDFWNNSDGIRMATYSTLGGGSVDKNINWGVKTIKGGGAGGGGTLSITADNTLTALPAGGDPYHISIGDASYPPHVAFFGPLTIGLAGTTNARGVLLSPHPEASLPSVWWNNAAYQGRIIMVATTGTGSYRLLASLKTSSGTWIPVTIASAP